MHASYKKENGKFLPVQEGTPMAVVKVSMGIGWFLCAVFCITIVGIPIAIPLFAFTTLMSFVHDKNRHALSFFS